MVKDRIIIWKKYMKIPREKKEPVEKMEKKEKELERESNIFPRENYRSSLIQKLWVKDRRYDFIIP